MTKKPNKPAEKPEKLEPLFIVGLDGNGKPRGARFAECDDRVVSAALDMNLGAVIQASSAFAESAKKLPEGRLYASGKAFIPNIKQSLLDELFAILRQPGDNSQAYKLETPKKPGEVPIRCTSPITSGLPRSWDEIDVGHLILASENPATDGYWECICQFRDGDLLTLRYRDAPKLPAFVRHVTTIALINPGPLASNK